MEELVDEAIDSLDTLANELENRIRTRVWPLSKKEKAVQKLTKTVAIMNKLERLKKKLGELEL